MANRSTLIIFYMFFSRSSQTTIRNSQRLECVNTSHRAVLTVSVVNERRTDPFVTDKQTSKLSYDAQMQWKRATLHTQQ